MSKTYKTEGIIIGKKDLRDADRLVIAYTKDFGKLKFVARGVKKIKSKLAGHLELFSYVKLVLAKGKNLDIAIAAQNIKTFKAESLNLKYLYLIAESIDILVEEGESDSELFEKFRQAILNTQFLVHGDHKMNAVNRIPILWFLAQLLCHNGYMPELGKCVAGGETLTPGNLYFSFKFGGVLCEKDKAKDVSAINLSTNSLKLLRVLFEKDLRVPRIRAGKNIQDEVEMILIRFIEFYAEKELKSKSC